MYRYLDQIKSRARVKGSRMSYVTSSYAICHIIMCRYLDQIKSRARVKGSRSETQSHVPKSPAPSASSSGGGSCCRRVLAALYPPGIPILII